MDSEHHKGAETAKAEPVIRGSAPKQGGSMIRVLPVQAFLWPLGDGPSGTSTEVKLWVRGLEG